MKANELTKTQLETIVNAIIAILYPLDDPTASWTSDTPEEIALVLENAGFDLPADNEEDDEEDDE